MATYTTPGAYIERQDATQAAINPLRTDVAGFVGLASRGPIDTPVPVESVRQFEAHFGSFMAGAFLAYAVRAFFENGGRRCWIVRVAAAGGTKPAAAAQVSVASASGAPRWRLWASSAGTWGNGISLTVSSVTPAATFSVAGAPSARYLNVASVAGFARGDLARLAQPGLAAPLYRVISLVDPVARRLYFVHPDAGAGLPYDRPLFGFDANLPLHISSMAYAIAVRQDGRPVAFFSPLTLVPEHPSYGPSVLAPARYPLVQPPGAPLPAAPPPIVVEDLAEGPHEIPEPLAIVRVQTLRLSSGGDGLADLTTFDFVGREVAPADSDLEKRLALRGLRAIDLVDEVAIVAAPDIVVQPEPAPDYAAPEPPIVNPCLDCPAPPPPALLHQPPLSLEMPPRFSDADVYRMQSTLVQLCDERRDRIALLDPTATMADDAGQGFPLLTEWRSRFDSPHAALYYPWVHVVDPLAVAPTRRVPPCGHVAGLYAQFDLEIGVHRAPANRVMAWAEDVTADVDAARHGELNTIGINVLRVQPGFGLRVLGARTLSSDPTWRFVNVRRLVMMVMKSIGVAMQWAVFEPNDHTTRSHITQALAEFFTALWARGALVGTSPEQAFAVRCDEVNNPPEARADGQLLAEVAIAPSQPFEFVVLRVGRQGNVFEITEAGRVQGGRS
jgi:Bacteriophage tail sheath protein